jgi:signal transduction histidine kinase
LISTDIAPDLGHVEAARIPLQQVIMNLLRNSIESLSSVRDRPRLIVLKIESRCAGIELSVEDAGIGFGPQGAERIFDAFFTTKRDGMGVGLSVSRLIIESHSGHLWARPNARHGVTVGFSIPTHPPTTEQERNEGTKTPEMTGRSTQ